jgi:hypothetical protein
MKARITIIEDESQQFFDLTEEQLESLRTLAKSPAFRMLAGLDAPVFSAPACYKCHIREANFDTGLCFTCEYKSPQ